MNEQEFKEAATVLRQDVANFIDQKLGITPGQEPDSERDRMVISALLDFAANVAVQDGSELGAMHLFISMLVMYTEAANDPAAHVGHGCSQDPLRKNKEKH